MSTFVTVNTYTHSVAFVTDKLLNSFLNLVRWIGLNPSKLTDDWETLERGIRIWIESKHLERVMLEIWGRNPEMAIGRWDFDIEYSSNGDGDGSMWTDRDAIKHAIKKAGMVPEVCHYRLVVTAKNGYPDVEGWGTVPLKSLDGKKRYSMGTTISTAHVSGTMSYWK